jgi:lysozyme family protein
MSTFEIAIPVVLKHEGFYSNDKDDPGGATNWGISLRFLQARYLHNTDSDIDGDGDVDPDDIKKLGKEQAINIYRTDWWEKYQYWRIVSQSIATKVFDFAVNMPAIKAHIILQRAVRATNGVHLKEDGILGKQTIAEVNAANARELFAALKSEAAGHYRSINYITADKYREGWLNRAYDGRFNG